MRETGGGGVTGKPKAASEKMTFGWTPNRCEGASLSKIQGRAQALGGMFQACPGMTRGPVWLERGASVER